MTAMDMSRFGCPSWTVQDGQPVSPSPTGVPRHTVKTWEARSGAERKAAGRRFDKASSGVPPHVNQRS